MSRQCGAAPPRPGLCVLDACVGDRTPTFMPALTTHSTKLASSCAASQRKLS